MPTLFVPHSLFDWWSPWTRIDPELFVTVTTEADSSAAVRKHGIQTSLIGGSEVSLLSRNC